MQWNAVVDDIDDAPDRARAVEERRRAANDFDVVNIDGLDGDGVVDARCRGVERRGAILENLNAFSVKPANHRTARSGSVIGGADSRFSREGFADGRLELKL